MARRVVVHEQDVVQTTGDHQARKGPEPAQAALAFILMQAWMTESRRRVPTHGAAAVLALGDVHGPVDQDREAQPGPGAKLQLAHAPFDAVAQGHQPHARELRQGAGAFSQGATTHRLAI
ncbi:hypothetical protein D3C85_1294090 [compost metagenome]